MQDKRRSRRRWLRQLAVTHITLGSSRWITAPTDVGTLSNAGDKKRKQPMLPVFLGDVFEDALD
jgi:hypothetical protein